MKTSVIEVGNMLAVWSVDEVEKRFGEVPGVESGTVNFAAESATVRYDETRLKVADIKSSGRQRGYDSTAPAAATTDEGREGHTAPGGPPATSASAAPKSAPAAAAAATAAPAGNEQQGKVVPAAAPSTPVAAAPNPSSAAPAAAASALTSAAPKSAPVAQPDKPGAASNHAGHGNHDRHEGHSPAMFLDRFWLSLSLTVPVQNLWWAAGYNIFAIPLAGGVLAPWGILLTPAVGAVLMSASTVVVAINAQLLKRVKL